MDKNQVFRTLLTIGCAYEIVALHSPLPTITELVHTANRSVLPRMAVWAAVGGAIWHFFVPEPAFEAFQKAGQELSHFGEWLEP